MKRTHRILLAVTVAAVLLVTVSGLAWRSAAAPPAQTSAPGGLGAEDGAAAAAPQAPVPGGPGFLMLSPFQFRPLAQTSGWAYAYPNLYNPGPIHACYLAPLTLPNKVTITQFVAYFYDNSAADLNVSLDRCSVDGSGCVTMAGVYTTGAQDSYRNVPSTVISSAVVDQQSYSYSVEACLPVDADVRLSGVRIDYAYGVDLPIVAKNH